MNPPNVMHKMKNIITRHENTILLQFVMPVKDTGIVIITKIFKHYYTVLSKIYL